MSERNASSTLRALLLATIVTLSVLSTSLGAVGAASTASSTTITACTTIDASGTYELTQNLSSDAGTCIEITANDVVLDGHGHTIDTTGVAVRITAGGAVSNVTIQNLRVRNASTGISVKAGTAGTTANAITIRTSDIESAGMGIAVSSDGEDASLTDLTIKNNTIASGSDGIMVALPTATGGRADSITVTNNDITTAGKAINTSIGLNATVTTVEIAGNHINSTKWGLGSAITVDASVKDQYHVAHGSIQGLTIRDNVVNQDASSTALSLQVTGIKAQLDALVITNNTVPDGAGLDLSAVGENATLSGTIRGNDITSTENGLSVSGHGANVSIDVTITNNLIDADHDSVYITGLQKYQEFKINLTKNTLIGRVIFDEQGANVGIERSITLSITNNQIDAGTDDAITIVTRGDAATNNLVITGNTIRSSETALYLSGPDNTYSSNPDATTSLVFRDNTITGQPQTGIYWTAGGHSQIDGVIEDNTIFKPDVGMEFWLTEDDTTATLDITSNEITNASTAGIVFSDLQLTDVSTITIDVTANSISAPSGIGIDVATASGTGDQGGTLTITRNDISAGTAAVKTSGYVDAITITTNVLNSSNYGVKNTAAATVNATHNYWGTSDGPASAGPYADPVTGVLANGSGSRVTNASSATTSNVHFAPWLSSSPFTALTVGIDSTTSPVTAGQPLSVTATVENTNDVEATQTVTLTSGGVEYDSTTVTLGPGNSTAITLTWNTTRSDAGTPTVTVASENDSASTTVRIEDGVPTADLTYSPANPKTGENVTFDGSNSTDSDGSIVRYEWDFNGDAIVDATGENVTHSYATPGTRVVTLWVTDDDGNTATVQQTVNVSSSDGSPTANFTYTPANPTTNEQIRFDASSSADPDGTIVRYDWNLDDDAKIEFTGETPHVTFSTAGNLTVTLRVTDDDGNTDTVQHPLNITQATGTPSANFTSTPEQPTTGTDVTFDASTSSDPNGTIVEYRWDFNGDHTFDRNTTRPTVTHEYATAGTYAVTLLVIDDDGNTAASQHTVTVEKTRSPPTADLTYSPTPVYVGEPVTLNASNATDSDGSITVYEWDVTGDGTYEFNTTTATQVYTFAQPGTYTANVRVTDDDGDTDRAMVKITVAAGAPTANLTHAPSVVYTDEPVTFDAANSTDPTNDIVHYEWDVTGDGDYEFNTTHPTLDHTYLRSGTYTVRVRVTDDDGNTDSATTEIAVEHGGPTANLSYSPVPANATEPVTLDASNSTDPTNDIVHYEWDVTGDGDYEFNTTRPTQAYTYVQPGTYTARVRVTDDDGNTDTITQQVTVVDHILPTVRLTAVDADRTPSTPPTGQTVHTNGTVSFALTANGTPGTATAVTVALEATFTNYKHELTVTRQADGTWMAVADLSALPDDGRYTVTVTATDQSGNQNETTTNVTIQLDRTSPSLAATVSRLDSTNGSINVTTAEPLTGSPTITVEKPDGTTETATIVDSGAGYWNATFELGTTSGQYNVTVTGTDVAGNRGTSTATTYIDTVQTQNNTATVVLEPSGLFVTFTTDQPVSDTVVMTESNTPLAPLTTGDAGVNFLNAKLGETIAGNLSHAVIGIPVDMSTVPASVDRDDVKLRYYNETSGTWERLNTTVEQRTIQGTTRAYWVANVTHFSTYGAVATDDTAPTITQTTPTDGQTFASGTTSPTLSVEYTDDLSGVNASAVTVRFDGVDVTNSARTQITSAGVTYTPPNLTNGSAHTLSVTITDNAGNQQSATRDFSIATPASFSVTDARLDTTSIEPGGTVTISAEVTNTGGETGTYTVVFTQNGSQIAQTTVTLGSGQTKTVTATKDFPTAGTYVLGVSGTTADTLTVEATDDTTPDSTPDPTTSTTTAPTSTQTTTQQTTRTTTVRTTTTQTPTTSHSTTSEQPASTTRTAETTSPQTSSTSTTAGQTPLDGWLVVLALLGTALLVKRRKH